MTEINATILLPKKSFEKTRYILLDDFEFIGVKVPKGFVTDGATIPRIFWPVLPPVHKYFPAAIVHDYLLTVLSRDEADKQFNEALKHLEITKARRYAMYGAVRLYAKWQEFLNLF